MKVKVTKEPFYFAGKEFSVGDVLEIPEHVIKSGVYGVTPVGKSTPLKTTYISENDVQETEEVSEDEELEIVEDSVEEVEAPKAPKGKGKNKK